MTIKNKTLLLFPYLLIGLFVFLSSGFFFNALASTMSDDRYEIDLQKQNDDTKIQSLDVKGANSETPGFIKGDNFTVEQGFSFNFGLNDFVLNLSPLVIDYGPFTPTNPITRSQNISINTGNAFSYSVFAIEDHELMLVNGSTITIPSTTCDDGLCSSQFASNWLNTLTYGFGYSCKDLEGTGCNILKQNYFKHFPNEIDNDNPETVMNAVGANKKSSIQLLYKVNTSTTQPKGLYSNTITYLALPGY